MDSPFKAWGRWATGCLLMCMAVACTSAEDWIDTVDQSALAFREERIDPLIQRTRDRIGDAVEVSPDPRVSMQAGNAAEQNAVNGAATWKGLPLDPGARLALRTATALGEHAIYHVPRPASRVLTDLLGQLSHHGWSLLETVQGETQAGLEVEYLSFWRDALSQTPQQWLDVGCALVYGDHNQGLTTLELSTDCSTLRQTATGRGQAASAESGRVDWPLTAIGGFSLQLPGDWEAGTHLAEEAACPATSPTACVHHRELTKGALTLTLTILEPFRGESRTEMDPSAALRASRQINPDAFPLLMQSAATMEGMPAVQLFLVDFDQQPVALVLREELHFLHNYRHYVINGAISGEAGRVADHGPELTHILLSLQMGGME